MQAECQNEPSSHSPFGGGTAWIIPYGGSRNEVGGYFPDRQTRRGRRSENVSDTYRKGVAEVAASFYETVFAGTVIQYVAEFLEVVAELEIDAGMYNRTIHLCMF